MTSTPDSIETKFRSRAGVQSLIVELDEVQASVVALPPEQRVAVFGSPGSGKTTVLIERVLHLLRAGLPSDSILAITANRESANALRDEIAIRYQGATAGPMARTLSSFAFGVLRQRAIAEGSRVPELISGAEQDRIIAGLIDAALEADEDELFPSHINKDVMKLNGFRIELRDLLTVCLEHQIDSNALAELGVEHERQQWVGAAALLRRYEAVLLEPQNANRFDPTSLLVAATNYLLETTEWPTALSRLRTLIVDDAQELTPAATGLIRAVCREGIGLVLLGDPDASTLGFRAADPRAMSDLISTLDGASGQAKTVFLQPTHAVRTPGISSVISRISGLIDPAKAGRQRRNLAPVGQDLAEDASVEGFVFRNQQTEVAWLARRLRELHLFEGIAWQDMAVVARSNQALNQLELTLAAEQVPVKVAGAQLTLRDEFASRALLRTLHFALAVAEGKTVEIDLAAALEMLTSPLCGLDNIGLRRLRRSLRKQEIDADGSRNSDELLVDLFAAPGSVATVNSPEGRQTARFIKSFFETVNLAPTATIEELLWQLWHSSGLASRWQTLSYSVSEVGLQANRNLDSVVGLFAAANRYVERNPTGSARVFVDQQLDLGLPEDSLARNDSHRQTVNLLTPSALIGKRFSVVALPGLIEGVWPNLRPRSSLLGTTVLDALIRGRIDKATDLQRSELPDELRMLHKAVGAATTKLLVTSFEAEEAQISQFVNLMLRHLPEVTDFNDYQLTLRGLAGRLRRNLAVTSNAAEAEVSAIALARLAEAGVAGAHPSQWYGLQPLSTTEPLFDLSGEGDESELLPIYPSQLENFVKCPLHWFLNSHGGSETTFSANLGTLVHKALEISQEIDEDVIWQQVESKWHTLQFEAAWLETAAQRKAKKMISNMVQYLRDFAGESGQVIGREASIEFEIGKAKVRGKVDRVELYPGGQVVIVDLKTGSRAYSKDDAQANPQLGLYQLGFENGAFNEILKPVIEPDSATLAGAKLLLVAGDKFTERKQDSISLDEEAREHFERLVAEATNGMSDRVFVARVSSHCSNENEYGTCELHLTKAVSYVG